ncbi:hypothetical protein [Salinimonas sediminis]|uniref:hypothetical protein n=1 Tax=Salinimonas sediminis TaxID=2303538 RepID=UPI001473949D|nr:hypothetical protein [Salinimonas sediminis]
MLFLTVLFAIVVVLFAYALSSDRGKNTMYARRNASFTTSQSMHDIPKKSSTKVVSVN